MPLTDIQIKALQPIDKRYLVSDGRGHRPCSVCKAAVAGPRNRRSPGLHFEKAAALG